MTPADTHTAVLAALTALEQTARAAQPFGGWYYSGSKGVDGTTRIPMALLSPDEMTGLDKAEMEDWIFTAATTADAVHIATWHPQTVLTVLAGRRRILERHAPDDIPERGIYCGDMPHLEHLSAWPCDDYRDAAADLLPNPEAT